MHDNKKELPALTGLRFFAAFAIVLDHLWPVVFKLGPTIPFSGPFHQLAFLGMSLFFVLSGFIIHYNYSGTVSNFSRRGLWEFFAARFSRLYPMFFLVVLYDIACGNFFLYANDAERLPYLQALPYYLTLTQSWFYGFVGNHPIAFPYHYAHVTWSISTEFFLYLTYPFINFAVLRVFKVRSAAWLAIAVSIVSVAILWWLKTHLTAIDHWGGRHGVIENPNADPGTLFSDWLTYISPYPRVLEFMTGCALAHLYMRASSVPRSIELICARSTIALALIDIGLFLARDYYPVQWIGAIGLLPAIAILIFCCARYDIGFTRLMSGATVVKLGEASYSMYLLHIIIIEKSAPTIPVPFTEANLIIVVLRILLILAIVPVISLAFYRGVEVPARRFLRSVLSAKRRPTPVTI